MSKITFAIKLFTNRPENRFHGNPNWSIASLMGLAWSSNPDEINPATTS